MAEFAQAVPLINSALLSGVQIIGGLSQRDMDREIAKRSESAAISTAADQKRLNRMMLSSARARMLQSGTDTANLGVLMQLALEGERRVSRIRSNGDLAAWYYRNQGDAALYKSLGEAAFSLGEGFAAAYENGLFSSDPPPSSSSAAFAPVPSGPPILVAPGVGTGGSSIPAGAGVPI
jgi:hypothetical protein